METRANHILIGGFVLLVVAAGFGFVLWLAKVDLERSSARYYVYFEEAVSGLGIGGDVRFNGIRVGKVAEIRIDPENPARVRVTIEVAEDTPVRTDTVASLAFQGITGVSFVQLAGGSPDEPLLRPRAEGDIPTIRSERSALHELFAGAPQVIDRVLILLDRLVLLVDDENLARLKNILANVDELTGALRRREPELGRILANVESMSAELSGAAREAKLLMDRLNGTLESVEATLAATRGTIDGAGQTVATANALLERDVRPLLADMRTATQTLTAVARRLDGVIGRNEESLDVFAGQGLVELVRFVEEARILVAGLERLLATFESDPAQFLFGRQRGGMEVK